MALYDNLEVLASGVAGTASVNGGWLDTLKGTNVAATNTAGVNQAGAVPQPGFPIYVQIQTNTATGTPSTTFTLQEADDTSGTNARTLGSAAVVTTATNTKIGPITPVKRYIRLNSAWTQGVLGYSAQISL